MPIHLSVLRLFMTAQFAVLLCFHTLSQNAITVSSDLDSEQQSNKQNNIPQLGIGDKVPDIEFSNILNYSGSKAKLSSFRGKLIILDFWATWCSPCVKALPKLQSLQKQFGDKIQIITVTAENKETVNKFFSKSKIGKEIVSPVSITNDSILFKLFRHKYIPHDIWIDEKGIVKAITSHEYITKNNITTLQSGKKIDWTVKD